MMTDSDNQKAAQRRGFRRKMLGTVTSDKMDKTVTVEVSRRFLTPKYKKYVRARSRYKAHDENNEFVVGDRVEIQESHPLSKTKRWVVTKMIAPSADRERTDDTGV